MIDRILEKYDTRVEGLNNQEVEIRQKNFGPNELKEVKKDSPLKLFLSQFTDVLIFLLIIASIASYFIGDYLDSAAILAVVAINSVIGFRQEYQAEQAMEKLKSLVSTTAIVKRENKILKVDARELTIGDIVLLEEGNKVPADLILIESHDLKIDESSLTGESLPVKKNCKYSNIENFDEKIGNIKEYSRDDDIHEKLAYMDSNVVSGRGTAVVIDVGMNTSIGKIATLLQEKEEETPLSKKVDRLGKMIGAIAIVVCIGVFFIDYYQGMNIVQTFMTAVSLAVAAIPEGLPAVLTLTLAIGMQKMARSNAIVRKLLSVETLGSCTVICTDKTGTLTKNKMTVRESSLSNKEMSVLISGACNNAVIENEEIIGDPTDGAALRFALSNDYDEIKEKHKLTRVDEIPLDSSRKRMTVIYKDDNEKPNYYIFTKGAPEIVLDLSDSIDKNGSIENIHKEDEDEILSQIHDMSSSALRVLGLGYRKMDFETFTDLTSQISEDNSIQDEIEIFEKDLTFTGLLGIMDPPREEAISAVRDCKNAGIQVVMITGDHKDTALAIAEEIGIISREELESEDIFTLTGQELEELDENEYKRIANNIKVYARVYPEQKKRIVETLQNNDNIVSMTGDGVNDAPALKKASIGVAMGSGTDVAKESADMIIQDDNFATIVRAIKEGRTIYDNLKRFLKFQLTTNIAAILTITAGSLLPIPTPFTPIQLLWINIIMDGPPAQSLGLEGPENDIMERGPERGELIGQKTFIRIIISGIIMTIGTLGLYCWELASGTANAGAKAMTVAFTVFVLYQLFNAFNHKSNSKEFNKTFWISIIGSFILQVIVIYTPFLQDIFKTCPIG
ncbi:MAG: cation-translocating P-type ATPase, partial [Methanobrevibacter sp.]|nr:cation-translocating P-type ATPase [Methanobrevibacter sp.]